MKKRTTIILVGIITLSALFYAWFEGHIFAPSEYSGEAPNIYVLSTASKVVCLSAEYATLTTIDLLGSLDLTGAENGKVYAAIAGNSRKGGKEIDVIQDGKLQKKIELTYSLPWISRYNPYNKKLYVGHKCKITYQNENCITVIDTVTDEEESNIMYNYGVEDMAFTLDNKMIVSAWEVTGYDRHLDVFDLETNSIIKTIPMGDLEISSLAVGSNGLVYGVTWLKNDPILYIIDWEEGEIDQLELGESYPYRVYIHSRDKQEYLYITHLDDDNLQGHMISVVDPTLNKVVREIKNVNCPYSIEFHNNYLLVGDWVNHKINIFKGTDLIKSIDIERPIDMVVIPQLE